MRILRVALLGIGALLLIGASCAPLPPEGGINVGTTSDQWAVQFDPVLGVPTSLVNRSLQDTPGSNQRPIAEAPAAAAVLEVFHSRPEWFRLRSGVDDFRLVSSQTRGWLRYLRFEQTYLGVSVAGAGYEAHVLPNGRVGSLEGRYHPGLNLDVRPLFSESQAEDRARSVVQPGTASPPNLTNVSFEVQNAFRASHVLAIVPSGGDYVLAWGVVVPFGARDNARVYVDAREGTPFARELVGWIPR